MLDQAVCRCSLWKSKVEVGRGRTERSFFDKIGVSSSNFDFSSAYSEVSSTIQKLAFPKRARVFSISQDDATYVPARVWRYVACLGPL